MSNLARGKHHQAATTCEPVNCGTQGAGIPSHGPTGCPEHVEGHETVAQFRHITKPAIAKQPHIWAHASHQRQERETVECARGMIGDHDRGTAARNVRECVVGNGHVDSKRGKGARTEVDGRIAPGRARVRASHRRQPDGANQE
jgi:hypothetical protein